jgi:hypothetical protein
VSGPIDLGPLTAPERELAWRVAGAAEAALGSRRPVLVSEVIAHLAAGLLFEHCQRQDADEVSVRIMNRVLERVQQITRENEALARAAIARAAKGTQA